MDGIKIVRHLTLRRGDAPGLSSGPIVITGSLQVKEGSRRVREGFEDATLLAVKMEGGRKPRNGVSLQDLEIARKSSSPSFQSPEGMQPCRHLGFRHLRPLLLLDL